MNVRLTILLAVIAVMIGATWAIIEFTDVVFREEEDPDEPWLFHIDESDITFIEVIHGGQGAQYSRDPASHQWMIMGDPEFPVFQQRWGGTPLLLSGPRVNRGLKTTIEDPAQYGLDPPETVVRVADFAGNRVEFHMGMPTPDGGNQYARLVGDGALYTVPAVWADVVNRLALDPPYGRLYDLEIPTIRVIEVTAGDSTAVYYLEGNQWLVNPGPAPVDPLTSPPATVEWADWLELLASPRVDAIADQRLQDRETERLEEYGFVPPAVRIVIARRGEATLEIQLAEGPPGSDSYYARTANTTDETLYFIEKSRLEGIEGLATNPLVDPDWEPLDTVEGEDGQEPAEGESSN